jgi:flagellar motility protein MotE (MotC chaperone)
MTDRIGRGALVAVAWAWLGAAPGALAQDVAARPPERMLEEVRERGAQLERRERELAERERVIGTLEARVEARLAEIHEIRDLVEKRIAEWEALEGDRVKRLAKVYSEMPPERAAPLLEQLELDLATQVLSGMKPKDSAAVLAAMNGPRALRLSRRVARPLADPPREEKRR